MLKIKIVAGPVFVVCALIACSAQAFAANSFVKTGTGVEIKGSEVAIVVPNAVVVCGEVVGKGAVASSTQVKVKAEFSSCQAIAGEGEPLKATVSPCEIDASSEGAMTLEGGCKVESSGCVLEPSTTENKNLKEVNYIDAKEAEESAKSSEIELGVAGITYKVKGFCEVLGIKGGKEGEMWSAVPISVEGATVEPERRFGVKAATPAETRKVTLESTTAQMFKPLGITRQFKCAGMKLGGTVEANFTTFLGLKLGTIAFTNCMTNLLEPTEQAMTVTVGTGCKIFLALADDELMAPQPGFLGVEKGCEIKFVAKTCKMVLMGFTAGKVNYADLGGTPKKVGATMSEAGLSDPHKTWLNFKAENCGKVPERLVQFEGASTLKAEFNNSTAADVEIV